jgi:hypothetical protein
MQENRLKRPRDLAQLAKLMIDIASGEVEDRSVNRRRTLTPPQLSHNQLKQHRNLQFSENLTGVQF